MWPKMRDQEDRDEEWRNVEEAERQESSGKDVVSSVQEAAGHKNTEQPKKAASGDKADSKRVTKSKRRLFTLFARRFFCLQSEYLNL